METKYSTSEFIKNIKNCEFLRQSGMPMGYVPGLPIMCILNNTLCLKIPFLKYKTTGQVDKTQVFSIRYVVTVIIPEGIIAGFEDLSLNPRFEKVDFNSPIGFFRHDAIKQYDKNGYRELREMLYSEYDKVINHLTQATPYTSSDDISFKKLLNTLIEPSLLPFYKVIDPTFSKKYLTR